VAPPSQSVPLIEFCAVTKIFGTQPAVDQVSFDLFGGEIVALLGQNGAGKSTLIKMLAGIYAPTHGEIRFEQKPLPNDRKTLPVAFIHQDLGLIEWMTVAENLALGTRFPRRRGLIDWNGVNRFAEEILERVGGGIPPRARIFRLSRTERALVAIARALACQSKVLVLDEPTSSLTATDVDRLFEVLTELRRTGVGMLYVSHRLDEVFRISDRVIVLRDGKVVAAKPIAETRPAELIELIVGQHLSEVYRRATLPEGQPQRLSVRHLQTGHVNDASFEVRRGEILGLTGLKGAGQLEVGRALFGLEEYRSGTVTLEGETLALASPGAAIRRSIGFVSANRHDDSLALRLTVRENFFLNPFQRSVSPWAPIYPRPESEEAMTWVDRFGIRPRDPEATLESLSGGNQQKVVLGRWIEFRGSLLILEEPTIGVDVGARADIYRFLADELERGLTVLLISTDFEEVANLCHRALIFDRGQIVAELAGDGLTVPNLIRAAAGG
jgi:ribose transport system ATP-binding protein